MPPKRGSRKSKAGSKAHAKPSPRVTRKLTEVLTSSGSRSKSSSDVVPKSSVSKSHNLGLSKVPPMNQGALVAVSSSSTAPAVTPDFELLLQKVTHIETLLETLVGTQPKTYGMDASHAAWKLT